MTRSVDVAVVGGGILGLAFAWESARRGRSVALFERDRQAQGASVRNFGMVWPIGQPPGAMYRTALRSRECWLELGEKNVSWVRPCGSVHAVYEDDEDAVIREFAELSPRHGITCEYLDAQKTLLRFPAINAERLKGALFSPTELVVDPREVLERLPYWLLSEYDVRIQYKTAAVAIESGSVRTGFGEVVPAKQIFVASGIDFETLFPEDYRAMGLRLCKLQMMRTMRQPADWKLGPHLAGGLTLTHYKSFEVCSALKKVQERIAATMPQYVTYGIHVMASQNHLGEVIIGDSHEYDSDISIFNSTAIDALILQYLRTMLKLPTEHIAARWHGYYAKHPTKSLVMESPLPGVTLLAAPGGAGMTLSFGFAREWWDAHEGPA